MMNCFYGMVDRRKVLGLIFNRDPCLGPLPSPASDMLQAGFESMQNLVLSLCKKSYFFVTVNL